MELCTCNSYPLTINYIVAVNEMELIINIWNTWKCEQLTSISQSANNTIGTIISFLTLQAEQNAA